MPVVLEDLAVPVVQLVAVPVSLVDDLFAVDLAGDAAGQELGRVRAEPHRAAHVDDRLLLVHQVDDRMGRGRVELGAVRVLEQAHVAGELDHRAVQTETQPEERDPVLACVAGRLDLARDAAHAEAAGHDDAVEVVQPAVGEEALGVVGRDPFDEHVGAARVAAVLQRLDDREVRVGQVDVLADEPDAHVVLRRTNPVDERRPLGQVGLVLIEVQHLAHVVVEALVVEDERDLVEDVGVDRGDDARLGHVAQLGDLLLQPLGDRPVAAAHDRVGLDAAAAQLGDRVLGRLRLLLARRADVGHERDVHVEDVLAPDVLAELPDRLEEGQDLDVADGAADLGDHDVDVVARQGEDPLLDLVGDVRDHLHGLAEILALALLGEHRLVDRAGGRVRPAGERHVDETLVVPEVEIGLALVVGDEHLSVLEGVHRAGIDVDVRVELLHRDLQATTLQQPPERRRREPLAEAGCNTTGHEDVLCQRTCPFGRRPTPPRRR